MTQKEIFEREKSNTGFIYLYREGIFWKAYEKSAFRLIREVVEFKPLKKYIKTIDAEIISVGFPCAVTDRYISKDCIVEEGEKQMTVKIGGEFQTEDFDKWKNSVPVKQNNSPKGVKMNSDGEVVSPLNLLLNTLRSFNIESHTPIECMMCLSELRALAIQI